MGHFKRTTPLFFLSVAANFILSIVHVDAGTVQHPPLCIAVYGDIGDHSKESVAKIIATAIDRSKVLNRQVLETPCSDTTAPNRINWTFNTHRNVWGGTQKGQAGQNITVTYLFAEVKLYIDGAYQLTYSTRPTVSGTISDQELATLANNVAAVLAQHMN